MICINLLPWRDQRREQQKRQLFVIWGIGLFLTIILWGLVHIVLMSSLHSQERDNEFLQKQMADLVQQLEKIRHVEEQKTKLLWHLRTLDQLQNKQVGAFHLLDDIAHFMPDGVYITNITRENGMVILMGRAESNAAISILIQRIQASHWLTHPILKEIKNLSSSAFFVNEFTLEIKEKK